VVRFVASLFILVTITFAMVHALPGDPVRAALGPKASPETVTAVRDQAGLDDPILTQYVTYLKHVITGDLGTSIQTDTPVSDLLRQRGPTTASLAVGAFIITLIVSIPAGMAAGIFLLRRRGGLAQGTFSAITGFLASIPDYIMCVVLVQVFAISLHLLPPAGGTGVSSFLLPIAALSLGPIAYLIRLVRAETQRVLAEPYMRTATAKRLTPTRVYVRHALPNILVSTLAVSGLLLIGLISGTVLVESIFGLSGLGFTLVDSVSSTDFPAVQSLALFFGAVVLTINLVVDLLIVIADPRAALKEPA
jgi:peptide/nickel transport system permease protein